MYKQTFPAPLVKDLVDLDCDHNSFVHRTFPTIIKNHGTKVFEELEASPESASDFLISAFNSTNQAFPKADARGLLSLRDVTVIAEEIVGRPFLILGLTTPKEQIGAHFIGLLYRPTGPSSKVFPIRYFTLERGYEGRNLLCEWTIETAGEGSSVHKNNGVGPKAKANMFQERVAELLLSEGDYWDSSPQK